MRDGKCFSSDEVDPAEIDVLRHVIRVTLHHSGQGIGSSIGWQNVHKSVKNERVGRRAINENIANVNGLILNSGIDPTEASL